MANNLLQNTGLVEIHQNIKAMAEQMKISSPAYETTTMLSISQSAGGLSTKLRKKVLREMPKKIVEQNGGKMSKTVKVDGGVYKCSATKIGKHCRYEIRPN